jgi:DNA-binding MarR family transcriptional regulator
MGSTPGARRITRRDVSQAMARLMPYIMRGVQLDFFVKRGVTQTQFLLLASIRAYTRCTMGTLARNLHVTMPTVSGVVDRLARSGHLRRVPRTDDRRQVVVELTAKGRAFLKDFQAVVRRRWEQVLRTLSATELEAFYDVLATLRERLQREIE